MKRERSSLTPVVLAPAASPHTALDWRSIPFDVTCGRCGAVLNGVVESRCPQCSVGFEWQAVLPFDQVGGFAQKIGYFASRISGVFAQLVGGCE